MEICLSCAKATTKRVSEAPIRMERMFKISDREQEEDDVEAKFKVVEE